MFDSLRSRLIVLLISFSLCILLVSLVAFMSFVNARDSLSRVTAHTQQLKLLVLSDILSMHEFFENDCINPEFFSNQKSAALQRHKATSEEISTQLIKLFDLQQAYNFQLSPHISSLQMRFGLYGEYCDKMIALITKRGFKDFGVEGEMREHAHNLEKFAPELGLIPVLQLRRHEKDFIIRQEDKYVLLHNQLTRELLEQLNQKQTLLNKRGMAAAEELRSYSLKFNELVTLERKLGLKTGEGLKKSTDEQASLLVGKVTQIASLAAERELALLDTIRLAFIVCGIVFIVLSSLFAVFVSRRISRSISYLNSEIDAFVKSDFTVRALLPVQDSQSEIDVLTNNFSIMEQQIVDSMTHLRQTKKDLEMLFYATSNDIRLPLLEVKRLTQEAIKNVDNNSANDYLLKIDHSWGQLLNIIDDWE